jgi:UDP-N-acetylmuramoylalanine--D-glutamate ligase
MIALNQCQNKKFLVFGLGLSGTSTINALSKFGAKIECWDDNLELRKKAKSKFILNSNWFNNYYDFIVISPGINIYKNKYKNFFLKYKNRIITDLDLFYSSLKSKNVIVVTGTNGKSTLTKLIYDLLKKSNKKAYIGGNYGKAVLDLPFEDKKAIFVLELSSYQIDYSKNIYSSVAIMLTISPDHLERHETIEKYISTKLKIFDTLVAAGQGFIDLNTNFKSKILRMVKKNKYKNILYIKKNTKLFVNKKLISLSLLGNHLNNLIFIAYKVSKIFNISLSKYIYTIKNFKGLPHRQEIVKIKNNLIFINDSKATNFNSSEVALEKYKNIHWIVGGLPKKNDEINVLKYKKNILKAYVIGKSINFFLKSFKNLIDFEVNHTLEKSLKSCIFNANKNRNLNQTVLLSPSAASFDQFKNFEDRGNKFKNFLKKY